MTQTVLTPCPTCGKRFDFPLTGCITGVVDMLLATSDGNCPECGTRVVVDEPPPDYLPRNPFSETSDARAVPIVNLELSVRCRLALTKLPAETVGDILDHGRDSVIAHIGPDTSCCADLLELFSQNNVQW